MDDHLRWPSFSCLDRKECEHGRGDVVVMKLLTFPKSRQNLRRKIVCCTEHKVFTPERQKNVTSLRFTHEKKGVSQSVTRQMFEATFIRLGRQNCNVRAQILNIFVHFNLHFTINTEAKGHFFVTSHKKCRQCHQMSSQGKGLSKAD